MELRKDTSLNLHNKKNVYLLKTPEDWRQYEALLKSSGDDFLVYNPNFYIIKDEFERYVGKIWQDKEHLRYTYNGQPVYKEYKIIAVEDNNVMLDWYWVLQNVNNPDEIKYVLCDDDNFEYGLKTLSDIEQW